MKKVWKFGGDAMANSQTVALVLALLRVCQVFAVFSAPRGVTNRLISLWAAIAVGNSGEATALQEQIIGQYEEIVAAHCPGRFNVRDEFAKILAKNEDYRTQDYLVSRGEWLMACIMGVILGWQSVDAVDLVILEDNGKVNLRATREVASATLAGMECAVIPGFYGRATNGGVRLLPRNTSDVTGALVAYAILAEVYVIWKKVRVRTADPGIVPNARLVRRISFVQMYELADGGAQVVHPQAVFPCHLGKIPIHVRDFSAPDEPATVIDSEENTRDLRYHDEQLPIVGVACRRGYVGITVQRHDMNDQPGVMEAVLGVFEEADLPIEHAPTGLQTISILFHLGAHPIEDLQGEIRRVCQPDDLQTHNIEVVTVVGQAVVDGTAQMAIFTALHGWPPMGTSQAVLGPSISIGVPEGRGAEAVRLIHAALYPAA